MKKIAFILSIKSFLLSLSMMTFPLSALCKDDLKGKEKYAKKVVQAIRNGDAKTVRELIEEKINIEEIKIENNYTPLMISVINNRKEVFDTLIDLDPSPKKTIEKQTVHGDNVLFVAIKYNREYMFESLIDIHPDSIKFKTNNNETLLHMAASIKSSYFLEKLLEKKIINIHEKSQSTGENFLHYLLEKESFKEVKLKDLHKKDDPELNEKTKNNFKTYKGITFPQALDTILKSKMITEADKLRLINDNNFDKRNFLHFLAIANDSKSLELVLEKKGVEIDQIDIKGATPLLMALVNGNKEAAEVLLENGADLLKNGTQVETYMYAFYKPDPRLTSKSRLPLIKSVTFYLATINAPKHYNAFIVEGLKDSFEKNDPELLEHFIESISTDKKEREDYLNTLLFSAKNSEGKRIALPLINAALQFSEKKEILEILLKNNIEIEFDQITGDHPFHYVIEKNNLELVKLFYSYMNPSDLNKQVGIDKTTFLLTAMEQENSEITEFLLKNGADPNINADIFLKLQDEPRKAQVDLFTFAALKGLDLKFFKLLMKYGADPKTQDSLGFNCFYWFIKQDRLDAFRYLLENMPKADILSMINHKNLEKKAPLLESVSFDKKVEFTRLMLEHGVDTDPFKEHPNMGSALEHAIINGSEKNAQLLLDHTKKDLNEIKTAGKSPFEYVIHYSVKKNPEMALRMVSWLLKNGADPNLKNAVGLNMLHVAVGLGLDLNATQMIAENIKNINETVGAQRFSVGHIIGARAGKTDLDVLYLKILIGLGLNMNQKNTAGKSVGHMLDQNRPEVSRKLKSEINKIVRGEKQEIQRKRGSTSKLSKRSKAKK